MTNINKYKGSKLRIYWVSSSYQKNLHLHFLFRRNSFYKSKHILIYCFSHWLLFLIKLLSGTLPIYKGYLAINVEYLTCAECANENYHWHSISPSCKIQDTEKLISHHDRMNTWELLFFAYHLKKSIRWMLEINII